MWLHTDRALRWTLGSGVPADELQAMLGGNPVRCYRIDLAELQDIADRFGPTVDDFREPV
jgi:hypothetical protein